MKKLLKPGCMLLLLMGAACLRSFAQTPGQPYEVYAAQVAVKMRDTLALSDSQYHRVYEANLALHAQKVAARQEYRSMDSLQQAIRRIEQSRSALYGQILSTPQYELYRLKRISLLVVQP